MRRRKNRRFVQAAIFIATFAFGTLASEAAVQPIGISGNFSLAPAPFSPFINPSALLSHSKSQVHVLYSPNTPASYQYGVLGSWKGFSLTAGGGSELGASQAFYTSMAFEVFGLNWGLTVRNLSQSNRSLDASLAWVHSSYGWSLVLRDLEQAVSEIDFGMFLNLGSVIFGFDLYKPAPIQEMSLLTDLTLSFSIGESIFLDGGAVLHYVEGSISLIPHSGISYRGESFELLFAANAFSVHQSHTYSISGAYKF